MHKRHDGIVEKLQHRAHCPVPFDTVFAHTFNKSRRSRHGVRTLPAPRNSLKPLAKCTPKSTAHFAFFHYIIAGSPLELYSAVKDAPEAHEAFGAFLHANGTCPYALV
jgi:hypothetical protein